MLSLLTTSDVHESDHYESHWPPSGKEEVSIVVFIHQGGKKIGDAVSIGEDLLCASSNLQSRKKESELGTR